MTDKESTLKYIFNDVGKLENGQELDSPDEEHCGVDWTINIEKRGEHLGVFIGADVTENQEIEADYTIKIVSKDKKKKCLMSTSDVFTWHQDYRGCPSFIDWKALENEYLDDGKLEVVAHVKITKMLGFVEEISRKNLKSFGEDMKQFSDVTLKVKERKFYVSKLYLSYHSPYFATLFLGKFQESEKSEIELKDVDPQDFQCYLEVLYLENGVDEDNVQGILSVADMFDTPVIVKKCEEFLVEKSKMNLKKKLELAGNYRLNGLKKLCMDQINSRAEISSVIPENISGMDNEILAELLRKALVFN
ncbi:hypothetical protein B9Z55_007625 [Caenorhabditis nigoni]|uniref:BTB domain-containing protein n=1 Tax=Caenorhabditis nigoni TaxID=1611254 RepID=A0A2G5VAT7_9PELO|nr:hypothetical protein B9Z55_007625 [Caenorhabditis nigoni]